MEHSSIKRDVIIELLLLKIMPLSLLQVETIQVFDTLYHLVIETIK